MITERFITKWVRKEILVHWVVGCLRRILKVWILKRLLETFEKIPNGQLALSQIT